MNDIPLSTLISLLAILTVVSAFFSGSETAMMAVNRYRLRHLTKQKLKAAIRVDSLLQKPDRLIGLILFGNNLVNMSAATIATIIGIQLFGEIGVALAPFVLTVVFLILAELMPKTVAALYPEKLAFPASYPLTWMMWALNPFIWIINHIANNLLKIFGIHVTKTNSLTPLSREELYTVVREASSLIPKRRKNMLLSILELEKYTIEDIMIPRNELVAINVNAEHGQILNQLRHAQYGHIPIYKDNLDDLIGVLHLRDVINKIENFSPAQLPELAREAYFVPNGTPLSVQLSNFQHHKKQFGMVVDEYGVIKGIVTLSDLLEEIIGVSDDLQGFHHEIQKEDDHIYLISGRMSLREINRHTGWQLPLNGPKTLNGMILERLEHIPEIGVSLRINDYAIEITSMEDNAVKIARIKKLFDYETDDDKETKESTEQLIDDTLPRP